LKPEIGSKKKKQVGKFGNLGGGEILNDEQHRDLGEEKLKSRKPPWGEKKKVNVSVPGFTRKKKIDGARGREGRKKKKFLEKGPRKSKKGREPTGHGACGP